MVLPINCQYLTQPARTSSPHLEKSIIDLAMDSFLCVPSEMNRLYAKLENFILTSEELEKVTSEAHCDILNMTSNF